MSLIDKIAELVSPDLMRMRIELQEINDEGKYDEIAQRVIDIENRVETLEKVAYIRARNSNDGRHTHAG